MTLFLNGEVLFLSSILRVGPKGSCVVNFHAGGVVIGIDEKGRLKNVAFDRNFSRSTELNDQQFCGIELPNYNECKEMVKRLAPRISRVAKLLSWDIAFSENGTPILIKTNMAYGGLFFTKSLMDQYLEN